MIKDDWGDSVVLVVLVFVSVFVSVFVLVVGGVFLLLLLLLSLQPLFPDVFPLAQRGSADHKLIFRSHQNM